MVARRGSALIVAMWVCVALAGLVLVMSYSMRIEAIAAANRLSAAQASAAVDAAEQYLLSVVSQEVTTPGSLDDYDFEAVELGPAYFWVLRPAETSDDSSATYGPCDEAAKIDLNTASRNVILELPGMTEDIADAILDWRDEDSTITGQGAEDDYYLSLPEPYRAKNGPFESVLELLLVRNITPEVLFGYDRNRNGTLDDSEANASGLSSVVNADSNLGIYPFVTVHGVQATMAQTSTDASAGNSIVDVNNPAGDNALRELLQTNLDSIRVDSVMSLTAANRPFQHVFDYYYRTQLTFDEFSKIIARLTVRPPQTTGTTPAKININTAPETVLLALGLDTSEASTVITRRSGSTDPADISWLVEALPRDRVMQIGALVTGISRVFSADIVATSRDGRAFKRFKVVIDGRESPPKIVYRRDMTSSGWPLPADVREALRAGEAPPLTSSQRLGGSSS